MICFDCIREVIRDTMDNKKPGLCCPKKSCKATIKLDSLTKKIDLITVDFLSRKIQKWLEKSYMESFDRLFLKFICPQCNIQTVLEKDEIHFICYSCRLEICNYCQQSWSSCVSHDECQILNYSGKKCFIETKVLPDYWDKKEPVMSENNEIFIDVERQSNVNLTSNEGVMITSLFSETLKRKEVTAITRIQNIKLWEKYVLKCKHMVEEIGLQNVKERALFHGTKASNIPLICKEGFDMRVETTNGAVHVKGIYFSTQSKYSRKYAGSSNQMFLARVLCGYSTKGSYRITRPPKFESKDRMYDSCVDNTTTPTIYVLFDNAQCYPAYIITYA
ncbi:Protein mono-ADP-ribosyltransferase parp12 [Bulinus truncatus]|nr:Protein mono-ADP-ribosyltransferase parp12 [Bulinus truncatus]